MASRSDFVVVSANRSALHDAVFSASLAGLALAIEVSASGESAYAGSTFVGASTSLMANPLSSALKPTVDSSDGASPISSISGSAARANDDGSGVSAGSSSA